MEEEEGEREMWMRRKEEFGKMGFGGGGLAGFKEGRQTSSTVVRDRESIQRDWPWAQASLTEGRKAGLPQFYVTWANYRA